MITEISSSVLNGIITFFTNFLYTFLTPIVNILWSVFPNLDPYLDNVYDFLNFIFDFVIYAIDLSMISRPVWSLVIISIIYRLSFSYAIYGLKLIVNWYHILMI